MNREFELCSTEKFLSTRSWTLESTDDNEIEATVCFAIALCEMSAWKGLAASPLMSFNEVLQLKKKHGMLTVSKEDN